MKIRIGTRGSKLALWQANFVAKKITDELGWEVELIKIKTKGDKILDAPLAKIGGKGLFVKEIEEAIIRGDVDIAVHSLKDMPTVLPEGLDIIAFTKREEPWDVFISKTGKKLEDMPENAIIGTSSLRRMAQIKYRYPYIKTKVLRGNLDTRLRKLNEEDYDGIIVALAGIKRLGIKTDYEVLRDFIPAIGQGVLAIESRKDHFPQIRKIINDTKTEIEVKAERAFLRTIGGSCQVPVGAYAVSDGNTITITGFIAHPSGKPFYKSKKTGYIDEGTESIGIKLAEELLEMGGNLIIEELGI